MHFTNNEVLLGGNCRKPSKKWLIARSFSSTAWRPAWVVSNPSAAQPTLPAATPHGAATDIAGAFRFSVCSYRKNDSTFKGHHSRSYWLVACSISSDVGDKWILPSLSKIPLVTNGLKKLDVTGTKIIFAASTFSKPVQRTPNSINPPLKVLPMYAGTQGTVAVGNGMVSPPKTVFGYWYSTHCKLVTVISHLEVSKDSIALLHLVSKSICDVSGKPTKAWRSLTTTGDMLLAARWNTLLDSPGCTGIIRQPSTYECNKTLPFGRSAYLTTFRSNKQSLVRTTIQSGDSPICIASRKSGSGGGLAFTHTAIATGNKLRSQTVIVFPPIPQNEQITPWAMARLTANRQSFPKL
jgi:hypothetical protein